MVRDLQEPRAKAGDIAPLRLAISILEEGERDPLGFPPNGLGRTRKGSARIV